MIIRPHLTTTTSSTRKILSPSCSACGNTCHKVLWCAECQRQTKDHILWLAASVGHTCTQDLSCRVPLRHPSQAPPMTFLHYCPTPIKPTTKVTRPAAPSSVSPTPNLSSSMTGNYCRRRKLNKRLELPIFLQHGTTFAPL